MKAIGYLLKPSLVAVGSIVYSKKEKCEGSPSVFSWGLNTSGQLGIGSDISRAVPTNIEELESERISKVFSSGHSLSSIAINQTGEVFTWGHGMDGVLGHADTDANVLIPTPLDNLEGAKVQKVACGGGHMAALTSEGQIFTWGLDDCGQCGQDPGPAEKNSKFYQPQAFLGGKPPTVVKGPLEGKRLVDVGCGRYFTTVVTEEGELYTWGVGRDFALGHGDKREQRTPKKVEDLSNTKIIKVACGRNFVVALDEKGNLYSWGNNDNGQLGVSATDKFKEKPQKIKVLRNVVDIAAGDFHVVAVNSKGQVYSWGSGGEGQLGHGNTSNQSTPRLVQDVPPVAKVACGGGHTALMTQDFKLMMVGRGRDGQLGRQGKIESVASYRTELVPVEFFENYRVLDIACGAHHSLAIAINS